MNKKERKFNIEQLGYIKSTIEEIIDSPFDEIMHLNCRLIGMTNALILPDEWKEDINGTFYHTESYHYYDSSETDEKFYSKEFVEIILPELKKYFQNVNYHINLKIEELCNLRGENELFSILNKYFSEFTIEEIDIIKTLVAYEEENLAFETICEIIINKNVCMNFADFSTLKKCAMLIEFDKSKFRTYESKLNCSEPKAIEDKDESQSR